MQRKYRRDQRHDSAATSETYPELGVQAIDRL
jgi:hypothetical protein